MSMLKKKVEPLPPLYDGWVKALLGGGIPAETDATCHDCAMCAKEGDDPTDDRFFNPDTQCCTYLPGLPNYLVGRILRDRSLKNSPVRAMVSGARNGETTVSPLGVFPTGKYRVLYGHNTDAFGRDTSMLCPYHVAATADRGPGCGIWRHRQATCATWFCKYVRGEVGLRFWRSLHVLLARVEEALRWWCVMELGLDARALRALEELQCDHGPGRAGSKGVDRLDQDLAVARSEAVWGPWIKQKERFYKESSKLVEALDWDGVRAIGGAHVALHSRLVLDAYAQLCSGALPERPRVGSVHVAGLSEDTATLICGKPPTPMQVPRVLLDVLHHFDGSPRGEALAAIEREYGISISPGLLRKMADHGVIRG